MQMTSLALATSWESDFLEESAFGSPKLSWDKDLECDVVISVWKADFYTFYIFARFCSMICHG